MIEGSLKSAPSYTRLADLLVFDAGSSSMFLQLGFQSRACTNIKIMVISGAGSWWNE